MEDNHYEYSSGQPTTIPLSQALSSLKEKAKGVKHDSHAGQSEISSDEELKNVKKSLKKKLKAGKSLSYKQNRKKATRKVKRPKIDKKKK